MSAGKAERIIFDAKLKAEKDYWVQKLSRELDRSDLRSDFERPTTGHGPLATSSFSLSKKIYEKLIKVTGGEDLLVYTFLLAALKVCLHKYTGNSSIVVGSPSIDEGGEKPQAANVLAILDDVDSRITFRRFLLQVQQTLKEAYERQSYPFDRLAKDLGIEEPAGRCPLFDVVLALKNIHPEVPEVGANLTIAFEKLPDGIRAEANYRSDLFHRTTIERFIQHLLALLGHALDQTESAIGDLHLFTSPERHGLLIEWNDTAVEYSGERCIHKIFEMQRATAIDSVAVRSEFDQISYGELNRRANQLAHYLQTLEVRPEVIVGICMEPSVEMIIGLLGILKSGGAYLPLDPTYPRERLRLMLREAQALVLLTQARLAELFPQSEARIISIDAEWHLIETKGEDNLMSGVTPDNLAYIIYTSGSTGQPKGVSANHRGLSCLVDAQVQAFELNRNDRVLQFASSGFDASVSEIFTTLAAGATLVLGNPDAMYIGPVLNQILKARDITTITLPPSVMAETVAGAIPALKTVVAAGDSCAGVVAARWSEDRLFINAYGPTEVTVCASLSKSTEVRGDVPPIGRPIAGKQVYLLDQSLGAVPIGIKGEIYVGGPGLTRGYLNMPDVTAERFIPDPFTEIPGGRLYRTGDLACYFPDGNIMFMGRVDHQVKIRGYRIELGEIENVLVRHSAIREAVVIVHNQAAGDKRLVAYVVPEEGPGVIAGELRNYLGEFLPEYMIPSQLVALSVLPQTTNGKVDRGKLPAPEPRRLESEDGYGAPRNELESELVEVFGNILNYENVGIYDNFFELGGHSLLAVQLISQIRDRFQVDLDVIAAFEAPTVAELAVTIVQAQMEQLDGVSEMLAEVEQLPTN